MSSTHPVFQEAEKIYFQLQSWRRHLHKHPELSFQEKETTAFVVDQLRNIDNIQILKGEEEVGISTGVCAVLRKGEGAVVALRADMDALPITEENNQAYCSERAGVMHACGHDAHTAILLGAAHILSEVDFVGTVKFLFQPAEEATDEFGKSGAPYFMEAGLLDDVSFAFALHMDPEEKPGVVKLHEGPSMANVDTFHGTIFGKGGHGAYPHLGSDPIWMLSFVIQAIQGIVSRKTSPLSPAVISIGEVKAGSSTNVIPDRVDIQGTIRSYEKETRALLEKQLLVAFSMAENVGGSYVLEVEKGEPALNNDSQAVSVFLEVMKELFPHFVIKDEPYGLGGEDFGYIAEKVPAAMLFLGAGFDDKKFKGLHMPQFDIQEEVLPVGVSLLVASALKVLEQKSTS